MTHIISLLYCLFKKKEYHDTTSEEIPEVNAKLRDEGYFEGLPLKKDLESRTDF